MDKKLIEKAIKTAKEKSNKRKFSQTIEFIMNFKGVDFKKQDNRIDLFLELPNDKGKEIKIGCFAAPELGEQAKTNCDTIIVHREFPKYKEKKDIKKLADSCDWFLAQATIMPDVAKVFGRVFGPKGKMPNPKAGCVVPPNANLKPLVERLKRTVRIISREQYSIKTSVGTEKSDEAKVLQNIETIYNTVIAKLPQGDANVKSAIVKLSMGSPVRIGQEQ